MTTQPAPTTTSMDRFFATLRRSPVVRSQHRALGGVAAGVATRLGIAPAIARIGFVVLAMTGIGVTLYLLAWLLLPAHDGRIHLERAIRSGHGGSIVLLVVTALSVLPDGHDRGSAWFWMVVAVAAVVALVRSRTSDPSTPTPPAPTTPGFPTAGYGSPYPGQTSMWSTQAPVPPHGPQDAPRG